MKFIKQSFSATSAMWTIIMAMMVGCSSQPESLDIKYQAPIEEDAGKTCLDCEDLVNNVNHRKGVTCQFSDDDLYYDFRWCGCNNIDTHLVSDDCKPCFNEICWGNVIDQFCQQCITDVCGIAYHECVTNKG